MKSPLLKNVKNITPKESIRLNKRVVTFLICLVVSAFLWIVQALSKDYTIKIDFPVKYTNFPKDKVVANPLPQSIETIVKIRGFNYLIHKLTSLNKIILIDAKRLKKLHQANRYYILPNSKIENISSQFNEDVQVLKVEPDTIFLNFNKKISKKVPVKVNIKIDYDEYYQPRDSLLITPEMITVSGAKEWVEKIKEVETKPVTLKKVRENISLVLEIIQTPELKLLELSPASVKATMSVTKYTEANIELPIELKNVPKGYNIKTFPDKVTVKCNVSLDNFEKIKPSDFLAIVDYSKNSKGSNKLKVELVKTPTEINSPKVNPERVEFIIRK